MTLRLCKIAGLLGVANGSKRVVEGCADLWTMFFRKLRNKRFSRGLLLHIKSGRGGYHLIKVSKVKA